MKIYIETYGCQMNEYDSEIVRSVIAASGMESTLDINAADVILLNTCAVREHAAKRVIARIHEIHYLRRGSNALIGVLGCMATGLKKNLPKRKKLPIAFVAGPDAYRRLPELIRAAVEKNTVLFDDELSDYEDYADVYPQREGGVNAWLAVMRGCNNFCSYCVVPYARGRERSRPPQSVVAETRRLVDEGFRQVTLLGQNVNSYHHEGTDFAGLLRQVSDVPGLLRVRFTSPHPKDFPLDLIEVMAQIPKICKHIHLPLQAGNDRILKLMRRTYSKKHYLDLVDKIRSRMPQIALSTDIIVGFPGETDAEFADTVEVMTRVRFDSAFIFKYSERPGTLAAKKYPDDVPDEVKTARIVRLNEIQRSISTEKYTAQIGEIQEILVEQQGTKKSLQQSQGRNDANTMVILSGSAVKPGTLVQARIWDATAHVLKGKPV